MNEKKKKNPYSWDLYSKPSSALNNLSDEHFGHLKCWLLLVEFTVMDGEDPAI